MSKEKEPTYLELISKDEKAVKLEGLQIKAQEASIEVSREVMNLNSQIAKKTSQVVAAQRAVPYNVVNEYKLTKELAELGNALEFVNTIKKSRFADITI